MRKSIILSPHRFCGPISLILLFCVWPLRGVSQLTQEQNPNPPVKLRPISLDHLYWHFFLYQSHLDARAAALASRGKDGSFFRNALQKKLGFSDADYAPIRLSSQHLASELAALSQQAKSLSSVGPMTPDQAKSLFSEREADIQNEILALSVELSPQKKAHLDEFLVQFFSPKAVTFGTSPFSGQSAGQAVQQ